MDSDKERIAKLEDALKRLVGDKYDLDERLIKASPERLLALYLEADGTKYTLVGTFLVGDLLNAHKVLHRFDARRDKIDT